jgi:hypothetical protein
MQKQLEQMTAHMQRLKSIWRSSRWMRQALRK